MVMVKRSVSARIVAAALKRPSVLLTLAGERQSVWRDGRRLHRGMQALLAAGGRSDAMAASDDWDRRRRQMRQLVRFSSPVVGGVHVCDRVVTDPASGGYPIGVRVYRPHNVERVPPVVVYAHGGGFVTGDLDTHDPTCRLLAVGSGSVVVSVDYRRAPEHRFPAAADDMLAVYSWVVDQAELLGVDGAAVGVMGDSAGGNLAAVVCQQARERSLAQPVMQGLIYPLVDANFSFASYTTFAEGFGLTRTAAELFRDAYARSPVDWNDPRMSPLLARDFKGLAPALVVTAGFDILRDEGHAYAAALRASGVSVTERCYDDFIHGFHAMLAIGDAEQAAWQIARDVGGLLRARR